MSEVLAVPSVVPTNAEELVEVFHISNQYIAHRLVASDDMFKANVQRRTMKAALVIEAHSIGEVS